MIQVQNLCKRFPLTGARMIDAVRNVSFTVSPGEVYGLLGPNGAGKTTTLRMVIGLLRPTSGQASIAGFGSGSQPDEVKRRVGIVSATAGLYPWLSVREYLLFFADLYGVPPARSAENLQRLSHLLDITEVLDRPRVTVSTGQKQRVQLARALMPDPPALPL